MPRDRITSVEALRYWKDQFREASAGDRSTLSTVLGLGFGVSLIFVVIRALYVAATHQLSASSFALHLFAAPVSVAILMARLAAPLAAAALGLLVFFLARSWVLDASEFHWTYDRTYGFRARHLGWHASGALGILVFSLTGYFLDRAITWLASSTPLASFLERVLPNVTSSIY